MGIRLVAIEFCIFVGLNANVMKKLLTLFTLCVSLFIQAQDLYHIPDSYFRSYLQAYYPQVIVNDSLDVQAAETITYINCSYREIASLDGLQFLNNLTYLDCRSNQLTELPELPAGLTELRCSSNQLTELPELPAGLTSLHCSANLQLTALPELPAGLTYLDCHSNQLTALPELPAGLTELICYSNQLTALPELPAGLTYLDCHSNQLTVLPELPVGLTSLYCYSNQLTALPELPVGLTQLWCNYNQLTALPELPEGLTKLWCHSNQLTALPELPVGLTELLCHSNQLTALPELPVGLTELDCGFNQITVLPVLPEGLLYLSTYGNLIGCVQYYPEQFEVPFGVYPTCVEGCIDSIYFNYSDTTQVDDGSCYPFIFGCTDSTAYNYPVQMGDEFIDVNTDDGTCITYVYMVDSLAQLNATALDSIYGLHLELETWNSSIELTEGWNMVGYGCPEPTDLVGALFMYEESIIIMKDNNGSVYMPEFGFNGIGDLSPGFGYQLKLSDSILDFKICD